MVSEKLVLFIAVFSSLIILQATSVTVTQALAEYDCDESYVSNRTLCREWIRKYPTLSHTIAELRRLKNKCDAANGNPRDLICNQLPNGSDNETCPTFNSDYFQRHNGQQNLISLSPYVRKISCDSSRFPMCIYEARCLCRGCIHPTSLIQDHSVRSEPVRIWLSGSLTVRGVSKPSYYAVGCTCAYPSEDAAPS